MDIEEEIFTEGFINGFKVALMAVEAAVVEHGNLDLNKVRALIDALEANQFNS